MSTKTTNYNLVKPAENETADISVINENMDIIDQNLKAMEEDVEDLDTKNVKLDGEQILTGVKYFPTVISNGEENHFQFFRDFEKKWHMEALEDRFSIVQSGIAERVSISTDGDISINGELNVSAPTQDLHAANKQYVDQNISGVITLKTAGGTATALTLGTATLSNGYTTTFIAASNNSASATTINGIPLYKPNTTTAPTLIAGKAYTIWYNSSTPCFFIKASAEGTAVAANVLAGTTFSNDNDTGITGAMVNNGNITKTMTSSKEVYTVPQGYHNGSGTVTAPAITLSKAVLTKAYITSSQTWTVPTGVTRLYYWMCGGGMSGGYTYTTEYWAELYGGCGGEVKQGVLTVTPGEALTLTVGAAGGDSKINTIVSHAPLVIWSTAYKDGPLYTSCNGGSTHIGDPTYITARYVSGSEYSDRPTREHPGYCSIDGKLYCGGGFGFRCSDGWNGTHSSSSTSVTCTAPTVQDGRGYITGTISATASDSSSGCTFTADANVIAPSGYGNGGGYVDFYSGMVMSGAYATLWTAIQAGTVTFPPTQGLIILAY